MARNAKILVPSEIRKRGYKLLLYADNRQHMQVLARIRRQDDFRRSYVGCWHVQHDDSGDEIVKGNDKKHCHVILSFSNPRYWSSILSSLSVSEQFCRPIGLERDTIEGGMVYLIHANAPDKEQYSVSDLFGAPDMVSAAERAIVNYQLRHVSQAESMIAIRKWITSHYGERITPTSFIDWVAKTPYIRTASNPWVYRMIEAHNLAISNSYADFEMERYKEGYERYKEIYDNWISQFEEIV